MSSTTDIGGLTIGYTAIAAIWITPLSILWFITFCLVRRKHDPARVGITWLKVLYPIWILALLFYLVTGGLSLWSWYGDSYYYSSSSERAINEASNYIGTTGYFFNNIANILLPITFVELIGGFFLCWKGPAEPNPIKKFSRLAILAWSGLLLALTIALFGVQLSFNVKYTHVSSSSFSSFYSEETKLVQLDGAVTILFWLTTLPLVGLAAFLVHKMKNLPFLRGGSFLVLACTILNFIRHTIGMAIFVHGTLGNIPLAVRIGSLNSRAVSLVVDPFFNDMLMFVILVILFALGLRKRKGLWLQPPQEFAYPAVAYVPATLYAPGQVPPGQQQPYPAQYQQQPPQMQQQQNLPAYLQVAQQQQQQHPQQQYQQPQQPQQGSAPQDQHYYPPQGQEHQQQQHVPELQRHAPEQQQPPVTSA